MTTDRRSDPWTLATLGAVGLWLGFGLLAQGVPMPKCLFHELTGLYCPGCGGTRAARSLLAGDVAGSLHQNALFPLALAASVVAAYRLTVAAWRRTRPSWHVPGRAAQVVALVVIGYAVLRNLPFPIFDAWRPT